MTVGALAKRNAREDIQLLPWRLHHRPVRRIAAGFFGCLRYKLSVRADLWPRPASCRRFLSVTRRHAAAGEHARGVERGAGGRHRGISIFAGLNMLRRVAYEIGGIPPGVHSRGGGVKRERCIAQKIASVLAAIVALHRRGLRRRHVVRRVLHRSFTKRIHRDILAARRHAAVVEIGKGFIGEVIP